MRQLALAVLAVAVVALACPVAVAVVEMPHSVLGSGGGEATTTSYQLIGTLGQPLIGVVSGASYINEIGFWYQPGWILTGVEDPATLLPTRFSLGQNHPNPFNPVTTLAFAVPKRSRVVMKLYDVTGREVRSLIDEEYDPGFHKMVLDASRLPSGVYFCRMAAGTFTQSRKLVLLK